MKSAFEFEVEQTLYGKVMIPRSKWSDSIITRMATEGCCGLTLNRAWGCEIIDLRVLESAVKLCYLNLVQRLELPGISLIDGSNIRFLSSSRPFLEPFDLSRFPIIEEFRVDMEYMSRNIDRINTLKRAMLFTAPESILFDLSPNVSLQELYLMFTKVSSLSGIGAFQYLTTFELRMGHYLLSLNGIEQCKQLKHVVFEGLKRTDRIDELGMLPNIETVSLINCGHIESILPLLDCRKLQRVIIGMNTVIDDGKVAQLLAKESLTDFRCLPRKHYDTRTSP